MPKDKILLYAKAHIGAVFQENISKAFSPYNTFIDQSGSFRVTTGNVLAAETQDTIEGLNGLVANMPDVDRQVTARLDEIFGEANVQEPYLLTIDSVLVSTGWNRNDDVFDSGETWAARHSPKDKPIDWEHVEDQILGHMKDTVVITKDLSVVADGTQDQGVPEDFHVAVRGVLYGMRFADRITAIQEQANNNELFVSMECWFSDYDYMIADVGIVKRNERTSFLDSHLRCNGGDGVYKGRRIGRVLRNIEFDGIGLVKHPANPDSIIYGVGNEVEKSIAALALKREITLDRLDPAMSVVRIGDGNTEAEKGEINQSKGGDNEMSKELEDRIKELEGQVSGLTESVTAKDTQISELTTQLNGVKTQAEEMTTAIQEKDQQIAEMTEKAEEDAKVMDEMKSQLDTIEKAKTGESRYAEISVINEADVEDADAEKIRLAELSDVEFEQEKVKAYELKIERMNDEEENGETDAEKAVEATEVLADEENKKVEGAKAAQAAKAQEGEDGMRAIARKALARLAGNEVEE